MARFTPASRRNPCPVCSGTDGSCSIASETFVLCHRETGDVPGWRFSGYSKNGFQQYFNRTDLNDRFDADEWERRRDERDRRKEEQRQAELFELSKALPIDERSAQNWQWLNQLNLDADHYENLKARGLSDRQIKFGGFKSVAPGQTLSKPVSPRLAGIDRTGHKVWVAGRGILCPAYNLKGQITGMQLRLDDGGDGGKYRWLKSQFGSKLPNGEMPITVAKPEGAIKRIGLAEGLLKPFIAAKLSHGTAFIGAAGGNFTASPQQLKEVILALLSENLGAEIVFYPDAGAIANQQVQRRDRRTLELLQEWDYEPKIAYWGQGTDKSALDIDELLAAGRGSEIEFLSLEEFDRVIRVWERKLQVDRAKAAYKDLSKNSYKPARKLNQQFLSGIKYPKPGTIAAISSPCKTGKTEQLSEIVAYHRDYYPEGKIFGIGYRNALLRQTAKRTGIPHAQDVVTGKISSIDAAILGQERELQLCLDSLLKIDLELVPSHSLIILDEAEAILKHAAEGGTLGNEQSQILSYFGLFLNRVLETGGAVLAMEDSLTDLSLDVLRNITGSKYPIDLTVNEYQASHWQVQIGGGGASGFVADLASQLQAGKHIFCPVSSQQFGEKLDLAIHGMMPEKKIVRLDSETVEELSDLMSDPDNWLESEKPDLLIVSPTAESGFSVWADVFDEVRAYQVNLDTRSQIQHLERYRREVPRYIYATDFLPTSDGGGDGFDPDRILANWQRSAKQSARLAKVEPERLESLEQPSAEADIWNRAAARFKARQNASQAALRENLVAALKERGHEVTEITWERNKEIGDLLKDCKLQIEERKAKELFEAEFGNMKPEQAKVVLKSQQASKAKRLQARKCLLADRLPGADLSHDLILKAVVENRGRFLRGTELLWMSDNPEIAAILDRKIFESALEKPFLMLRRFSHNRLKADLINAFDGLKDLLDGREYREKDETIVRLKNAACERSTEIWRILGLTVNKQHSGVQVANKLLGRMGVAANVVRKEGKRGEQKRIWAIEQTPHRATILDAFDRKFAPLLEEAQNPCSEGDLDSVVTTFITNRGEEINNTEVVTTALEALQEADSGDSSQSSGWTGLVGRISETISRAWDGAWWARGQAVTVIGEPAYNDFFRRWQIDCQLADGQVVTMPHEAFELEAIAS